MSRWDELSKDKKGVGNNHVKMRWVIKNKKGVGNNHVKMRWVIKRQKGSWK